jgi:hypothetical protein
MDDPTVAWHAEGEALAATVQDGVALARSAQKLRRQLPNGPVTLLARGPHGLAIAAACAATRSDPTRWEELHLGRSRPSSSDLMFLVEAVELGTGMRRMLEKRYPQLRILDGLALARGSRTLAA